MNKTPLTMTNQSSIRLPFSYTASGHNLIEPSSDIRGDPEKYIIRLFDYIMNAKLGLVILRHRLKLKMRRGFIQK